MRACVCSPHGQLPRPSEEYIHTPTCRGQHGARYVGAPSGVSCARMAQVCRHGGRDQRSPGLLPALSGHGERIAR
eukprot:5620806-Prymnesium_polylepis.1